MSREGAMPETVAEVDENIRTKHPIKPTALYTPVEAGRLLGFTGKPRSIRDRLYRISREDLPQIRLGPSGGRIMYLGTDLVEYVAKRRVTRS